LGVKILRAEEEQIKNSNVKKICNLQAIDFYIKLHTWTYMEKIACEIQDFLPRKISGSRINQPLKIGLPQKSYRNLFVSTLQT
jgi:hypothetical protein